MDSHLINMSETFLVPTITRFAGTLFIYDSAVTADPQSVSFMPLVGRYELDPTVAMPVVLPLR